MAAPVRSTSGDVQLSWDASFDSGGTAVTNAFNAGTDSNRFLVVTVVWDGASAHTMPDAGVTYNSVGMTAMGATVTNGSSRIRSYGLIAPATGSNTLSVDPSTGVGTEDAVITALCYAGVDQTTAYENYTTANGADASAPLTSDVTITSGVTDRLVWTSHGCRGTSIASGVATGFTERSDNVVGNVGIVAGEATGAASVVTSVEWTGPASITWGAMGASLIGAGGGGATCAVTGTLATGTKTQADVVAGGQTIILTLTGDTFLTPFDADITAALTEGLDAASSPTTGWNNMVRSINPPVATWVRTSATVATCTLSASAAYAITADEVITITVPAAALTGGVPITATPTITIHEGVVLSAYSGTTNASGVLTTSLTSDQASVRTLTRAYVNGTEVARTTTLPA